MAHRLLLADDSVTIRRVIELTFADEDVTVVAVSDGDQAIARLAVESFDIVLADIGMPGKDGFEVAAYVREQPGSAKTPVILLTGAFDPVDDARVNEVGASLVLAKPFEPQLLVARVRDLLKGKNPSRMVQAAKGGPDNANPADALLAAPPQLPTGTPSVDDYFERLDRAFASLNAPLEPRDPLSVADRQEVPGPDPAAPAAVAVEESGPALVAMTDAPVAPAAGGASAGLADTFATLLAVEQGELPAPAAPAAAPAEVAAPVASAPAAAQPIDDELVDRIARRVVEHLSDRAVRELAADIVSRTAERVVREEIERIKAEN